MNTIWQALAWKEWRESRWKLLAVLGTILLSLAALWSTTKEMEFSNIQIAILLPILPISLLIATTTAAHEQSIGTMPFLCALPVSQRRVAVAKLVAGLVTCLAPVFIVLALLFAWRTCWDALGIDLRTSLSLAAREWRGPFNLLNWFAATACAVTLWVVSVFLWSAAAGVRRADEVSAGAMALALIGGVWLTFMVIAFGFGGERPQVFFDNHPTLVALVTAIAPGAFPHMRPLNFSQGWTAWCVVGQFLAVQIGLAAWFVIRFGGNPSQRIRSHQSTLNDRSGMDWLASPRRSPIYSIAWKQFRESGPVVLAGVAGVVMMTVAGMIITARSQRDISETKDVLVVSAFFGCIYVGGFTTVVVGIGVFLRDLEPGIHTFWRSRPIGPNTWYWIKVTTGVVVVGLTFLLPMLILPSLVSPNQFRDMNGESEILRLQMAAVAVFAAAYSIAVATTCLTRSAVYATVLTILGLYLGALLPAIVLFVFRWLTSPNRPMFPLDGPEGHSLLLVGLILSAVVGTTVGWLAIRYDWGRQRR